MSKSNKGEKVTKHFPCPVCKATGMTEAPEYEDGFQITPGIDCYYCEGEGSIEIGSELHIKNNEMKMGMLAIRYFNPPRETWTINEIQELGERINKLTKQCK